MARQLTRSAYIQEIEKRCQAYRAVFDNENSYAQDVIKDLVKFCKARETTYHKDARDHAFQEGARAVWLRIEQYTMLTPEEIADLTSIRLDDLQSRQK